MTAVPRNSTQRWDIHAIGPPLPAAIRGGCRAPGGGQPPPGGDDAHRERSRGALAAGRQVLQAVDPLGTHLQVQVFHVLDHHLPGSRRRGRAPPETICYCRVSSPKQRDDLQRQVVFMRERYPDARVVTDVGGGLNFQRKGLVALLERLHRGDKLRIVVAHRDRLARFGFDLIRWMAEQNGGEIVVLGNTDYSPQQELTEDILAILHTFSCRLHGLRRYRNAIQADTCQWRRHVGPLGRSKTVPAGVFMFSEKVRANWPA